MQLNSKTDKYQWTNHSLMKMRYYGLSQQRVKRVIKSPERIEEGIVEKTIASMQTAGSEKHPYEIWVMYQTPKLKATPKVEDKKTKLFSLLNSDKKLKIISAWRYPGKSPKNNPIPEEILQEIRNII